MKSNDTKQNKKYIQVMIFSLFSIYLAGGRSEVSLETTFTLEEDTARPMQLDASQV